jgi:hypothetical protein
LALDPNRSRRAWIEGPFFQRVAKRRRIDQFKPAARRPDLQELVAPFGDFSRVTVDEWAKFDAVMAAWEERRRARLARG